MEPWSGDSDVAVGKLMLVFVIALEEVVWNVQQTRPQQQQRLWECEGRVTCTTN
jgi:hypothetical protein